MLTRLSSTNRPSSASGPGRRVDDPLEALVITVVPTLRAVGLVAVTAIAAAIVDPDPHWQVALVLQPVVVLLETKTVPRPRNK
jgi:hypothetical protein